MRTVLAGGAGTTRGHDAAIAGFGSRAERSGRNPATGEAMTIKASKVPKFTPGKALKDQVNESV